MKDDLDAAVAAIRARAEAAPVVGVVLGSGLGGFADALEDADEIPYDDIPGWPQATAVGHAGTSSARSTAFPSPSCGAAPIYTRDSRPPRSSSASACSACSAYAHWC